MKSDDAIILPHEDSSERYVLGALVLNDDRAIRQIFKKIRPEHFRDSTNRIIFKAAQDVFTRHESVDFATILRELKAKGHQNGIAATLGEIGKDYASTAGLAAHIKLMEEAAKRNQLLRKIEDARNVLLDDRSDIIPDLEYIAREFRELGITRGIDVKPDRASVFVEHEPCPLEPIIEGLFDRGDKVALIGSSKQKKSFFALQLAMCLAAGRKFLQWEIPEKMKVSLFQFEIKRAHFHRRVRLIAHGLGLKKAEIDGLAVFSLRGVSASSGEFLDYVEEKIEEEKPDLIIFDPLYKMLAGDENSPSDMKPLLLRFDSFAEQYGCAVLYTHHDAKGTPGDRDIRDRGAGTGVLGRDYDAAFTLTPHAHEVGATVLETLARNYPPTESSTIVSGGSSGIHFEILGDVTPIAKSSFLHGRAVAPKLSTIMPSIREAIPDKVLAVSELRTIIEAVNGVSRRAMDEAIRFLTDDGTLKRFRFSQGRGGGVVHLIGPAERIDEFAQRKLEFGDGK